MPFLQLAILSSGDGKCARKQVANVASTEFFLEVSITPVFEFCLVLNVCFWDSVEENFEQFALIIFRHWSEMDGEIDSRLHSNINGFDT